MLFKLSLPRQGKTALGPHEQHLEDVADEGCLEETGVRGRLCPSCDGSL